MALPTIWLEYHHPVTRKKSVEHKANTPRCNPLEKESRLFSPRVVALISEYRHKRYRSVWFREEHGSHPNPPQSKHANNNADHHIAAREALQGSPAPRKTAAIPLEFSRIESGQSSGYNPAQLSRTSLLGKPLKSGRHKGPRYRKSQALVYNFLERPRGCRSVAYHVLL